MERVLLEMFVLGSNQYKLVTGQTNGSFVQQLAVESAFYNGSCVSDNRCVDGR